VKVPKSLSIARGTSSGFDEAKYLFYVQDLVSKSLLYDEIVALFGGGTKPYTNLRITPFGEEFLGFIEGFPDQ